MKQKAPAKAKTQKAPTKTASASTKARASAAKPRRAAVPSAKQARDDVRFAAPTETRHFEHQDGRTYSLQVVDCRVDSAVANGTGARTLTLPTEAQAHAHALAKVRELERKGYRETKRTTDPVEPPVDVVEVRRAEVDALGDRRCDYQSVPGRPHCYAFVNTRVLAGWLVTSDDRTRGIEMRCMLDEELDDRNRTIAEACLDVLLAHRTEILADSRTALRRFPLPASAKPFDQVVVLSPTAARMAHGIYDAFPSYTCETTGTETVALADARCRGRGSIPTAIWDREPHPVLDLAYVATREEAPDFKVFDPEGPERWLSARALQRMKTPLVIARNHAGETRTFKKSDTPDLADLRRFFGYR